MYHFDKKIERRGTNSVKWDVPFVTPEVTPMWIADMDFEVAPAIKRNLHERVGHGVFGYQFLSERYYQAVIGWMKRRHGYEVERDWICFVPNVVMGISYAVQAVSEPGDEIILHTPVYGPFFHAVEGNGRVIVESTMKNDNGYYTFDYEDFEKKITPKTKAVILCNPHNPAGRVWTKEELQKIADICMKHNLYIISDDIHSELVFGEHKHTFVSTLSGEIGERCIICTSPSKAFNLAGIHVANCIIKNRKLREKFAAMGEAEHAAENNSFCEAALLGAYEESEEWLDELNTYLEANLDYAVEYIRKYLPQITVFKPEGTYLAWLDMRNVPVPEGEIRDYLLENCRLAVNDGTFFGEDGKGFVRLNVACPRSQVEEALVKLKENLEMMQKNA